MDHPFLALGQAAPTRMRLRGTNQALGPLKQSQGLGRLGPPSRGDVFVSEPTPLLEAAACPEGTEASGQGRVPTQYPKVPLDAARSWVCLEAAASLAGDIGPSLKPPALGAEHPLPLPATLCSPRIDGGKLELTALTRRVHLLPQKRAPPRLSYHNKLPPR